MGQNLFKKTNVECIESGLEAELVTKTFKVTYAQESEKITKEKAKFVIEELLFVLLNIGNGGEFVNRSNH